MSWSSSVSYASIVLSALCIQCNRASPVKPIQMERVSATVAVPKLVWPQRRLRHKRSYRSVGVFGRAPSITLNPFGFEDVHMTRDLTKAVGVPSSSQRVALD